MGLKNTMNSEQQWWTDVNSSCLHPWHFLAMQSYSLYYHNNNNYYYYFVSIVISSFCLDTVPLSFIFRFLYISKIFFWFEIVMNFWTACHPCVCVLSVSVLIGYDCLAVMFQCKLENSFYRESTEQSRCCSSLYVWVNM